MKGSRDGNRGFWEVIGVIRVSEEVVWISAVVMKVVNLGDGIGR